MNDFTKGGMGESLLSKCHHKMMPIYQTLAGAGRPIFTRVLPAHANIKTHSKKVYVKSNFKN